MEDNACWTCGEMAIAHTCPGNHSLCQECLVNMTTAGLPSECAFPDCHACLDPIHLLEAFPKHLRHHCEDQMLHQIAQAAPSQGEKTKRCRNCAYMEVDNMSSSSTLQCKNPHCLYYKEETLAEAGIKLLEEATVPARCPKCNTGGYLGEGCLKIVCSNPRCNTVYCYQCLADITASDGDQQEPYRHFGASDGKCVLMLESINEYDRSWPEDTSLCQERFDQWAVKRNIIEVRKMHREKYDAAVQTERGSAILRSVGLSKDDNLEALFVPFDRGIFIDIVRRADEVELRQYILNHPPHKYTKTLLLDAINGVHSPEDFYSSRHQCLIDFSRYDNGGQGVLSLRIARFLVSIGADVNQRFTFDDWRSIDVMNAVELATECRMENLVIDLIRSGTAEIPSPNRMHFFHPQAPRDIDCEGSFLHRAALTSQPGLVKMLLERGESPNIKDYFSRTPLNMVLECRYTEDYRNSGSSDPSKARAEMHTKRREVVKLLLNSQADVNNIGRRGLSCIEQAARLRQLDIFFLLSMKGADVSRVHGNGRTVLHALMECYHEDGKVSEDRKAAVQSVVDMGVDINGAMFNFKNIYRRKVQISPFDIAWDRCVSNGFLRFMIGLGATFAYFDPVWFSENGLLQRLDSDTFEIFRDATDVVEPSTVQDIIDVIADEHEDWIVDDASYNGDLRVDRLSSWICKLSFPSDSDLSKYNILMKAVKILTTEAMRHLINLGVLPNFQLLCQAAWRADVDLVEIVLQHVDIEHFGRVYRDAYGQSPLHLAVSRFGDEKIISEARFQTISTLVESATDKYDFLDARDDSGLTAEQKAGQQNWPAPCLERLEKLFNFYERREKLAHERSDIDFNL